MGDRILDMSTIEGRRKLIASGLAARAIRKPVRQRAEPGRKGARRE
jgi:hypothetical protein